MKRRIPLELTYPEGVPHVLPSGLLRQAYHKEVTPSRTGLMLAHDVIEHVNGFKVFGTKWDEVEALGAVYFVRGLGQLAESCPTQLVVNDLLAMFDGVPWDDPHPEPFKSVPQYLSEIWGQVSEKLREQGEIDFLSLRSIRTHFCRGFLKIEKRFHDPIDASNLFYNVETEVDAFLQSRPPAGRYILNINENHYGWSVELTEGTRT